MTVGAFFESPECAVEALRRMLLAEDWPSIAPYYDLDDSTIDIADLVSGEFFIRHERPQPSHPGGFWRYKHPFPPRFEFANVSAGDAPDIVVVHLRMKIDQGAGAPQQEGWSRFRMRRSADGYQVLPD